MQMQRDSISLPTPVWPTIVLPITKLRRAVLPSHVRKPPSAAYIIYARARTESL